MNAYCLSRLEKFILVIQIGEQNNFVTPMKEVTEEDTFCFSKHGKCARETLANKLNAAVESGVAIKFLNVKCKKVNSLGHAGARLENTVRRFCVPNCDASVGQEANSVHSPNEKGFFVSLKVIRDDKTEVHHPLVRRLCQNDCLGSHGRVV